MSRVAWEYMEIGAYLSRRLVVSELNRLGLDGWELCQVAWDTNRDIDSRWILKRPVDVKIKVTVTAEGEA